MDANMIPGFLGPRISRWFAGVPTDKIYDLSLDESDQEAADDLRSLARIALGQESEKERDTIGGGPSDPDVPTDPLLRLAFLLSDSLDRDGSRTRPIFEALAARPWLLDESLPHGSGLVSHDDDGEESFYVVWAGDLVFVTDQDHVAFALWVGDAEVPLMV